jgi:hypothetical protein
MHAVEEMVLVMHVYGPAIRLARWHVKVVHSLLLFSVTACKLAVPDDCWWRRDGDVVW